MRNHYSVRMYACGLVAACLLTGCRGGSGDTAPSSTSSTVAVPSPEQTASRVLADGTCRKPEDADRTSASSTAATAAAIMHCWDSTMDRTQTAAMLRAKPLMSSAYAKTIVEPERNGNQAQWVQAYPHEAYSVPKVTPTVGDMTRDVASDKAIRSYTASWTWKGRDGQSLPGGKEEVVIYLEKSSQGWEIVKTYITPLEVGS